MRQISGVANFAASLLFNDVKTRFTAEGPAGCSVVFGRREAPKQINQGTGRANRVVFQPGDPSGRMGAYEGAKLRRNGFGSKQIRSLQTIREVLTVFVWAVDATDAPTLNDELKQYEACRLLHDYVVRAIYRSTNVGHGSFTLSAPQWVVTKNERKYGAELMFTLEIEAAVPDEAPTPATALVPPPQTYEGPTQLDTPDPPNPDRIEADGSDTTPTP